MRIILYAAGITNTKEEMNEDASEADIDDEHEVSTGDCCLLS